MKRAIGTCAVMVCGMLALGQAATGPGKTAAEGAQGAERAAAEKMVKVAEAALRDMHAVEAIRPRTSEFCLMEIGWSRKLLDAQLLLNPSGPARRQAAEAHLKVVTTMGEQIRGRAAVEGGTDQVKQADYAEAEAEYLLAHEK